MLIECENPEQWSDLLIDDKVDFGSDLRRDLESGEKMRHGVARSNCCALQSRRMGNFSIDEVRVNVPN